ncbi:hypothetical protein E4099_14975 [Streptomyces palmae]|uniref:Uncharacterized protein n=1 Tax=Streptomyces palmae TaxID=1701085 RepID=A0A4Z0H6M2_9ACTN|nr:hypothetical protein E4099_14975 [Streptomyces palmae]
MRSRLLPWPGPNGQPAYLLGESGPGSHLWRLADEMEGVLLRMGAELVQHGRTLAGDPKADARQLRYTVFRLAESLTDAHRIAESRKLRLEQLEESETGEESDSYVSGQSVRQEERS